MRCSLLTTRVTRWVETCCSARILNLFDQVCNLVNANGDVISLVTDVSAAGPFSAVVEGAFSQYLSAESPVRTDPLSGHIVVGDLMIETAGAAIWHARPAWEIVDRSFLLKMPPIAPRDKRISHYLHSLLTAMRQDDVSACRSAVGQLAGVGNGLTPAGDDVLMGVLYALWAWKRDASLVQMVAETAAPRTTTLSAAYLRAAAAGEATIHWHKLLKGEESAIDRILSIGHSSGADAWSGFISASHAFAQPY